MRSKIIRVPYIPSTSMSAERMEEGKVICKIDEDKNLNYEIKRWLYLLILPLSWLMTIWAAIKTIFCNFVLNHPPKSTSIFFDRFSSPLFEIRLGAASWRALDIIYHWFEPQWRKNHYPKLSFVARFLADFWIGMINAQAVRNRFRLASRELEKVVEHFSREKEIKILSIAAGSGEVVIKEIAKRKKEGIRIVALLLDKDPTSCLYAKRLSEEYRVSDQVKVIEENIRSLEEVLERENFTPHIIEMIGFLDYRPKEKAVSLINRIYNLLKNGGVFITCHIRRNPERWFLRWVISWWMIYRQPKELVNIICSGGFEPEKVQIYYEPHTIHGLVIAQK